MPKSPEEMEKSMIENLKANTGKGLDEWMTIVKGSNLDKHGKIVTFLKTEHGLTHGYANFVVHKAKTSDAGSKSGGKIDLVDAQYRGEKSALRPIYEKLIKEINSFGGDVEIAPKNTYVSLRRKKQFALIQPSTKTRIDVGINLKDDPFTDRFEASGSFNAMVSHRVRVSEESEVNNDLIGYLKKAYDRA